MAEKTFAELEAQADAMISALTAQRNSALDTVVNLAGQNAILQAQIARLTSEDKKDD